MQGIAHLQPLGRAWKANLLQRFQQTGVEILWNLALVGKDWE